ncbi:MAG: 23S rRNA (uracil(1939)-C(5))-methyltransferase RlmD [Bacilli bacterium]|jgi:23S rRNA (uracil-5-)-methyltransferase RumA|nr:23S rRNA (uracil(1939)-C(5))-methyltransferase RlmD [Bacilli bacterium]HHU23686.1 23S rRNA (uracil(1939)-C(5))-methyltransferase RlmD [Acholeplasmataceae bacterium]
MNILNKNQEILLSIKRIGINGEGIGYYKRLAVFVPGAIPGEEVVVRITEVFEKYANAQMLRFKKEPSPQRITPPCPYYDKCGGCQMQHISYDEQLRIKKDLVMAAFERYYNKELNPKIFKDTIGMANPWRYRNKAKLPVRYDGKKLVTGLYAFDSNRLVFIDDCIVEKELVRETVSKICDYLTKSEIIAYEPRAKDGVLRHLVVRESQDSGEVQVTLILFKEDARTIKIAKELINLPNVASVYISINDDPDALENFGEKTTLLAGKPEITEKLGEYYFDLLPTAFFQLNVEQTQKLYEQVAKVAKLTGNEMVVDGYCGVGTIALWLSGQAKEVRGIDLNPEAIKNAKENAIKNKVTNASFYVGNVSGNLQQFEREGFVPDLLVVDPPRTGMDAKLLNYLQNNPVPRIIYVSCNPSTLAKNCSHLQSKYQILSVQPLDMFPQTAAVESVVLLQRR